MRIKVLQPFKATINGVPFYNENAYYTVGNIIDSLECISRVRCNSAFLTSIILEAYNRCIQSGHSVEDFEESCVRNIEKDNACFLPKSRLGLYTDLNKLIVGESNE